MPEKPRQQVGRLKIFLGYCAGVGKTYAMLQAARQRQQEGVDVLVGWVDTHGRKDTEAMLTGLPVLDRKPMEYRQVQLPELDLDMLLRRHPQLVLVDELAHTNVPGSRHRKRWQDVEEILKAGIDVYTTLNIQHLESLNDVVSQITRVKVRETIPDRILDGADEIRLIDLPPDELLQRLNEGKVYVPAQARRAAQNFFGPGKLTALRELVMRRTAERVEAAPLFPPTDRLLVCVGPSPFSERLIRSTKRLATQLNASWEALTVATDSDEQLERNLALAESLGGHPVRLSGPDVAATTLEFARSRGVTTIICGRGALSEALMQEIDVLVVSSDRGEPPRPDRRPPELAGYALALASVAVVTVLGLLSYGLLATTNLAMFYLLAVVLTALRTGRGPATAAAALGVVALDFFFVPPRFTFAVSDTQYLLTFAALLVVGVVVGRLTARVREQVRAAERGRAQVTSAFDLSKGLAGADTEAAVFQALLQQLEGASEFQGGTPEEEAVASWVRKNGLPAGRGTDTLPAVPDLYLPVHGHVLRLSGRPPQRQLLETLTNLAGMALERVRLTEEARRTQILEETERLQSALLNSLSHDLQTPITSLIGALDSLADPAVRDTGQALAGSAREQAERLRGLVANLLDITRLESRQLTPHKELCALDDLIGSALGRLEEPYRNRPLLLDLQDETVLVDEVLFVQVLCNLLDNAARYSPPGTPVKIDSRHGQIRISDQGPGIPPEMRERVFDKFQHGAGLGLAICKGLMELHGGSIRVDDEGFVLEVPR